MIERKYDSYRFKPDTEFINLGRRHSAEMKTNRKIIIAGCQKCLDHSVKHIHGAAFVIQLMQF